MDGRHQRQDRLRPQQQLHPPGPTSPAAAFHAQTHASKNPTFIPVYAIDGLTQIGVLEIPPVSR
jgi:hypothetical protein